MSSPDAALPRPARSAVAPATTSERGDVGRVLAFVVLSVALAAAVTITRVDPAVVPFILAFGPTAIAGGLAWREGHGAVRGLFKLAVTPPDRPIWFAILALPVVWALTTVVVAVALGAPTAGLFDRVVPAIFIVPAVVLLPAFAEEIAWRGYAVPRLLPSMSPLVAALALGVPWSAMHLFLELPGQMNAGLAPLPTVVSLLSYSIVLTWLVVRSGGGVFLAALLHAGFNGVVPLMGGLDPERAWVIRAVLIAIFAVAVVAAGGLRQTAGRRLGPSRQ